MTSEDTSDVIPPQAPPQLHKHGRPSDDEVENGAHTHTLSDDDKQRAIDEEWQVRNNF